MNKTIALNLLIIFLGGFNIIVWSYFIYLFIGTFL